jgi:hypothetical protein
VDNSEVSDRELETRFNLAHGTINLSTESLYCVIDRERPFYHASGHCITFADRVALFTNIFTDSPVRRRSTNLSGTSQFLRILDYFRDRHITHIAFSWNYEAALIQGPANQGGSLQRIISEDKQLHLDTNLAHLNRATTRREKSASLEETILTQTLMGRLVKEAGFDEVEVWEAIGTAGEYSNASGNFVRSRVPEIQPDTPRRASASEMTYLPPLERDLLFQCMEIVGRILEAPLELEPLDSVGQLPRMTADWKRLAELRSQLATYKRELDLAVTECRRQLGRQSLSFFTARGQRYG